MVKPPIYAMSPKLLEGTILSDQSKGKWIIGGVLGQGGFGCIYAAKSQVSNLFDKVIKLEPSSNGPLFTEINFYKRAAKDEDIKKWIKLKKLDFIGMPKFISCGLYEDNRFLVMDRFGDDLHKSLMNDCLSKVCILQVSINMLDILEYIHSMEYSHADIKALNIMRGYTSPSEVYLLDFGMTSKFSDKGVHKPEKVDPKCKNNGTVEFSPRDSHAGLPPSRRGDMESLLYNVIFWLTWDEHNKNSSRCIGFGLLPWLSILKGIKSEKVSIYIINQVAESKLQYMKSPQKFIESVGLDVFSWSKYLVKMLTEISKYKYDETPDYEGLRRDLASIISEIEKKPLNINENRKVRWDSVVKSENTKIKKSLKRASSELGEITVAKKRGPVAKMFNNSSNLNEIKNDIGKEKKNEKENVRNIFKNFEDDTMEEVSETNDENVVKNNREHLTRLRKRRSKENASEENEILAGESSSSAHNGKIPGLKSLNHLKSRNQMKILVSKTPTRSPKKTDVDIVPGLKNLKRFKGKNRTPKRNASAPTNSVSCQTTPSISKNI